MAQWLDHGRPDETPIMRHGGQQITLGELRRRVLRLAARIAASPARRWALCFDSTEYFLVALLATLHAGKIPVIPGTWQGAVLKERQALFDALLSDDTSLTAAFPGLPGHESPDATNDEPLPGLNPDSTIELFTSGSTGLPRKVTKTVTVMDREADWLATLFGHQLAGCHVVASVSHQHLYGLTFRIMLPMALGLTLDAGIIQYPEQLLATRTARPLAFVSSPAFLKRLDPHLASPQLKWTLSAGGLLPAADARHAGNWLGVPVHEIYGSTETGVLAWRTHQRQDPPWQAFPQVRIESAADGWRVHSPLIDDTRGHRLDDVLVPESDGRFRLQGRTDRIVKIEEKRISLDEVERRVRTLEGVQDACAVYLTHGTRQELGIVLVLNPSARQPEQRTDWLSLQAQWRRQLRRWLEPVAIPRHWRIVSSIPSNSMGKRIQSQLQGLFHEAR